MCSICRLYNRVRVVVIYPFFMASSTFGKAHQEDAPRGRKGPTQAKNFGNFVKLSSDMARAREPFAEDRECCARCSVAIRPAGGNRGFFELSAFTK